MALQVAAVIAALGIAQKFLDVPLVKRMLQNAAAASANKVDDWIIRLIYDNPEEKVREVLDNAQKTYDITPPETRDKMKAEPSRLLAGEEVMQALGMR